MRSSLFLVAACGLLGCVSFPHASLLHGTTALEVVTGPVVCGPLGFRKVPLQSRWGEYVRVTVAAPAGLRGTAVVHAAGVVQADRAWSTESDGALVVETRFPNEDPDRRFVLERERPIDITLNNLEALGGGTCEGAVFTVEHGALVPSIDERAWVAELERRGGPALAARREAARLEADARRQAHYAQWETRHVEVSAALVAQADQIRAAHYAQWEVNRAASLIPAGAVVAVSGAAGCVGGNCGGVAVSATSACPSGNCERAAGCVGGNCGGVAVSATPACPSGNCGGAANGVVPSCVGGNCGGLSLSGLAPGCVGGNCVSPSCLGGDCGGVAVSGVSPARVGGKCGGAVNGVAAAGVGANSGVAVSGVPPCVGGDCGGAVYGVAAAGVGANSGVAVSGVAPCIGGNCGGAVYGVTPSCVGENCGGAVTGVAPCVGGNCGGVATREVAPACVGANCEPIPLNAPAPIATVTSAADWSQPSDAHLRATADVAWVRPPDSTLRADGAIESSWTQPFEPRLEPVAVTTESQVAVATSPPEVAAAPVDPGLSLIVPAVFQVMFNLAGPPQAARQQVHGARPVGR